MLTLFSYSDSAKFSGINGIISSSSLGYSFPYLSDKGFKPNYCKLGFTLARPYYTNLLKGLTG
jgi:hypothetical protein